MRLIGSLAALTVASADEVATGIGVHDPPYFQPHWAGGNDTDCKEIYRIETKVVDHGQYGHITGKNYVIRFWCHLSFGQQCQHGVRAEVQDLNFVDGDYVYFTYVKDGVEYWTETMTGCLEGSPSDVETNCKYVYEYTEDYRYHYFNSDGAEIVGKYDLLGTNVRVHFRSGYSHSANDGGIFKFKWKCLPAPSNEINSNDDPEDDSVDPDARDPYERLLALEAKALEVVELGGWDQDSAFHKRVTKKLDQVITKADQKRLALDEKCDFPAHWDWQEYLASQNEERYNEDDPCLATQQVFLGFSRWMEIYTKHCKKGGDAQLNFQKQKVKQLNVLRNKMFVDMECAHYMKKYNL